MQDFVCKVKATAQRIKDCGGDLPDSQVMAKLISGLTSTFSNFVSSFFLLADDKRDDVDKATKLLINPITGQKGERTTRTLRTGGTMQCLQRTTWRNLFG